MPVPQPSVIVAGDDRVLTPAADPSDRVISRPDFSVPSGTEYSTWLHRDALLTRPDSGRVEILRSVLRATHTPGFAQPKSTGVPKAAFLNATFSASYRPSTDRQPRQALVNKRYGSSERGIPANDELWRINGESTLRRRKQGGDGLKRGPRCPPATNATSSGNHRRSRAPHTVCLPSQLPDPCTPSTNHATITAQLLCGFYRMIGGCCESANLRASRD